MWRPVLLWMSALTVSIIQAGPSIKLLEDKSRDATHAHWAPLDRKRYRNLEPTGKRKIQVQTFNAQEFIKPVILFSGGWGENFRWYSQVLNRIQKHGYPIINIDHYYHRDTHKNFQNYRMNRRFVAIKNRMKQKELALGVFYEDLKFVYDHLNELVASKNVILMGHSLGGNACKKLIEALEKKKGIRSRF